MAIKGEMTVLGGKTLSHWFFFFFVYSIFVVHSYIYFLYIYTERERENCNSGWKILRAHVKIKACVCVCVCVCVCEGERVLEIGVGWLGQISENTRSRRHLLPLVMYLPPCRFSSCGSTHRSLCTCVSSAHQSDFCTLHVSRHDFTQLLWRVSGSCTNFLDIVRLECHPTLHHNHQYDCHFWSSVKSCVIYSHAAAWSIWSCSFKRYLRGEYTWLTVHSPYIQF